MVDFSRDAGRLRGLPTEVAVTGAAICVVAFLAATALHSALVYISLLAAIAFAISLVPRRYRSGALIAVAVAAAVDGLPGRDLTLHIVRFGLYEQDFAVFLLIGLLAWEIHSQRLWGFYSYGLGRLLLIFALLNIGWWVFTLYRTTGIPGIAVNHAANFGRQFLYVAVLTPLFAGAMHRSETRRAMFVVLGAWSIVLSGVSIYAALHQTSLANTILHVRYVIQTGSVARLYVYSEDLLAVALVFSWAFFLMAKVKWQRRFAVVVLIFTSVAVGVLQTRADYFGCGGGAIVGALCYLRVTDWGRVLRRLALVIAAVGVVILALYAVAPQVRVTHAIGEVATRAASSVGAAELIEPGDLDGRSA